MPLIERIVTFLLPHAALTVLAAVLLTLAAGYFTATHFAMNTEQRTTDLGQDRLRHARSPLTPNSRRSNLIAV